jgi:hypothetical protein
MVVCGVADNDFTHLIDRVILVIKNDGQWVIEKVAPSSKVTPCFCLLATALLGFHSKRRFM